MVFTSNNMKDFIQKIISWLLKLLTFLRLNKPTQPNEPDDDTNSYEESNTSDDSQLPATKEDLRQRDAKDAKLVKVERMNDPQEEILKDDQYKIVGFAKTLGKWTQKILDHRKGEISFDNVNEDQNEPKIFGKWTAYIFTRQSKETKKSWQENVEGSQKTDRGNSSKDDRGR